MDAWDIPGSGLEVLCTLWRKQNCLTQDFDPYALCYKSYEYYALIVFIGIGIQRYFEKPWRNYVSHLGMLGAGLDSICIVMSSVAILIDFF